MSLSGLCEPPSLVDQASFGQDHRIDYSYTSIRIGKWRCGTALEKFYYHGMLFGTEITFRPLVLFSG